MSLAPLDSSGVDVRRTGSLGIKTSEDTTAPDGEVTLTPDSSRKTVLSLEHKPHNAISPSAEEKVEAWFKLETALGDLSDDTPIPQFVDPLGDDDPTIRDIPWAVRRVVSLTDDPTLPTITFRFFVLSILFVVPGAFLSQLSQYRTTSAPYSIFFTQICSNYLGEWLATILPAWQVNIPFSGWSFNTNPGPFSVKEHVLIVVCAASGATYNLAFLPISVAELYFDTKLEPVVAIIFMWTLVLIGYSYAALARSFLIYDPIYPWYQALCQTALFETQRRQRENPTPGSRRQMTVFFLVLLGVFAWQFLPEFVFPMLSSLAFLCWVAPHNSTANFIGSGLGGMGFLNLSLDWSNVGNLSGMGSLFLTPWWTQVIVFTAFVVNCWILIPAAKWGGMTGWNNKLMSNRPFQGSGSSTSTLSRTNMRFRKWNMVSCVGACYPRRHVQSHSVRRIWANICWRATVRFDNFPLRFSLIK